MGAPKEGRSPLKIMIDDHLRVRMIELHISPTRIAMRAFKAEIRLAERKLELRAVRQFDPRITDSELKSSSPRTRRLRRKASVL
jgi:hypothetical protein